MQLRWQRATPLHIALAHEQHICLIAMVEGPLTDITVMMASAPNVPANTRPLFFFSASNTAMKKVLSPSSENKMSRNPDTNPSLNASLPIDPEVSKHVVQQLCLSCML